ncbi:MAG: hypothetical protein OXT74_05975, partial [Candidatus Poribacteria bacterium]|nr:hypothetical protein [Candidatus Poribacteria bacterium]
ADGALPNNFSKECYEDVMAFKSQVLAALAECRMRDEEQQDAELTLRLLGVDEQGNLAEEIVELPNV